MTPLSTDDGRIVLFNRGWVPQEQKDPAKRAQGQVTGRVDLTGIVRRNQERRQFAPENVPDKNVWFHVDVPLMRGMAGGKPEPKLDAFFLDADAAPNPGGLPIGGQTRLDIPNDHLQYAITWFLLALALAGVYLAYHWENGRLTVAGRTKVKPKTAVIANDPYAELERRFARLSAVNRASSILNWDRSTMMPAGASEDRADQLATLGVIAHGMIAAPDMPELLSRAEEGATGLDRWRAANLREMRRLWVHESALPADLVEARTRASSACEMVWREAKKNADFKSLLPTLSEVLAVMRRVGEAKAAALGTSLYDALLDEFEPGGRSARIDELFGELRAFLPDLLGRVMERQASAGKPLELDGPFPDRAAAQARRGDVPPPRLRLHARPARRLGASLHRRHGRRRAHHHALRRARLRARPDGHPARDRPWRSTKPACRATGAASRSAMRAAWRCTRASRC